ncbi:MAG: GNVR domain-containing protein [Candidatus Neomarinimicrobiota bacterium]
MRGLTPHEQRVFELVRRYPEIIGNRGARAEIAGENGMSEKTLRNRIADLKRYGLVSDTGLLGSTFPLSGTKGDIPVIGYIKYLLERWVTVALVAGSVSIFVAFVSLVMPKTFRATAVIMPSEIEENSPFFSALQGLSIPGLNIAGNATDSNRLLAILASRTVGEKIVKKFDLVRVYDVETLEEALLVLDNNLHFSLQDEGTIRIDVDAKTPWLSSQESDSMARVLTTDLANSMVQEVDFVNKELNSSTARLQRDFIERRLEQNAEDLARAEENLKAFQEFHGTIQLPAQTEATITLAAELSARIMANEVAYEALKSLRNPDSPEIKRVEFEIAAAERKLAEIEKGLKDESRISGGLFPVLSDVPDLGMRLARLERELEVQTQLYTFLVQQYEQARIQETRDTPTIQVLDWAKVPEKKYKPQRALMVFISSVLATVFCVVGLLFWEKWKEFESTT